MNKSSLWTILFLIVILIIGAYIWKTNKGPIIVPALPVTTVPTPPLVPISVSYSCDAGKTIQATFDTTANTATILLSDGRTITLPHAVSADGARYVNADGSIVFWSKGNTAFLMEGTATTYANCVAGTNTPSSNGMTTFSDASNTFSFQYPTAVTVSGGDGSYTTDWMSNNPDQTLGILLAQGTLPGSFEPNTNLSDSKFTVGTSSDPKAVTDCLVAQNGDKNAGTTTINGIKYTKLTSTDAGAGNFYNTTSYRTVRNNQCYAIEYTIHSGNIDNYPPGQITAFNSTKVQGVFEGIVQSFKFL